MNATLTRRATWMAPLLLFALALAMRLAHLDDFATFDELYHVLAARGWLAEGEMRIAEGTYERAPLYTLLVAQFFALFGESLEVARVPSVLAGAALVVLVFVWTRKVAGALAAWLAALLVCFAPDGITTSQIARFYALHGLLFWLGAIGTYRLLTEPPRGLQFAMLAAGTLASFALALALHLQPLTLIGLVGLGLWVALAYVLPWLIRRLPQWSVWLVVFGLLLLGAVGTALFLQTELGAALLAEYRGTPLWMAETRNAFWYYHLGFMLDYPTLWSLSALAVLVSLAYRPQPAAFCTCVFAVAFFLLSFAGPKGIRFMYWAMPFLFVLWGMALAFVWPSLRHFLEGVATRALASLRLDRLGRPVALSAVALTLVVTLVANGVFPKTVATMAGVTLPPNEPRADWAASKPQLAPWLAEADIVLSTSELHALYYLGRYDILISKSRLGELESRGEFTRDYRTGRPVISTPESVEWIMDCYDDGLIVSSDVRWRSPSQLDDEVANLITARAEAVELEAPGVLAYVWQRPDEVARPSTCATLADLTQSTVATTRK
jgi:4-amino-4-deoxy-L-arabinose transferase-like glycosyltransferase